jgi:hypothetical protein
MLVRSMIGLALLAGVAACGGSESEPTETGAADDRFPSVLEVAAEPTGERTFNFSVTISSPYDSPERFADGWRILTPDGEPIAEHELLHDHAGEQPFTREQLGVEVPAGLTEVVVEGRDSENGYGGRTRTVELP